MKITNLSSTKTLQFNDLGMHMKGVSPILRDIKLKPSTSKYLLETSEVLLSAQSGDIHRFLVAGLLSLDDTVTGAVANDTLVLSHDLGLTPRVMVLVKNGANWEEATKFGALNVGTTDATDVGDYSVSHNAAGTQTTITFKQAGDYKVRLY